MHIAEQLKAADGSNCPRIRHGRSPRRTVTGFTLTELAITMSVAAILLAVAVPSFSSLIANQRAKAVASELYAALSETRSAAITLNQNVTVSAKTGGWAKGWQVLGPNNNVLEDRGTAGGVTVSGAPAAVTYTASGRLPSGTAAPMFVITTTGGGTTAYQCVSIDLGGHPYMHAAATC